MSSANLTQLLLSPQGMFFTLAVMCFLKKNWEERMSVWTSIDYLYCVLVMGQNQYPCLYTVYSTISWDSFRPATGRIPLPSSSMKTNCKLLPYFSEVWGERMRRQFKINILLGSIHWTTYLGGHWLLLD